MTATQKYRWGVAVIVAALVLAPLAGTAGATMPHTTPLSISADQKVTATSNVDIWKRAVLPLRTDKSNAEHTVALGSSSINIPNKNTGDLPANLNQAGVFNEGASVTVNLQSVQGAGTESLSGETPQLIVGRITPEGDAHSISPAPTTVSDVKALFDTNDVNKNITFLSADTASTAIASDGSLTMSTPALNKPGVYVIFMATGGGFSVSNGDLSVTGQNTIIGMTDAVVQSSSSTVSVPSNVHPGDTASFDITTPATGPTNHTILIYKKSTFVNSDTTLEIDGPVDGSTKPSDITIHSSIAKVNGVADYTGPVTILGQTLHSKQKSGTATPLKIYDFATMNVQDRTGLDASGATFDATASTVLDASATGVSDAPSDVTLDVKTFSNWTTGKYVWIAISGDKNDLYTNKGTFSITPATNNGGGGGPTGGGGGGLPPSNPTNPPGNPDISLTNRGADVTIHHVGKGQTVQIDLPNSDKTLTNTGIGLNSLSTKFANESNGFKMHISTLNASAAPADAAASSTPLGFFNIQHTQSDKNIGTVTFTFTATQKRLTQAGVSPSHVALYRKHDSWHALKTTLVSQSNDTYTFEATSPGFSLYEVGSSPAHFDVGNANAKSVTAGQDVTFTATVTNNGGSKATKSVPLVIDGDTVISQKITLAPGESTDVSFSHTFSKPGDYSVSIGSTSVGTVHVSQVQTSTTTTQSNQNQVTSSTSKPGSRGGFPVVPAIIVLIVVIAAVAGLYVYRYQNE